MQREEDGGSKFVSCITTKLIEDVCCRGPIAVAMTDLLKNNHPLLVENERGRICGFVRRIPTQAIQIGYRIVRIRHENDVGGQFSLLLQKILGVLIQVGGSPWIISNQSTIGFFEKMWS
jgi:hypothetical protein